MNNHTIERIWRQNGAKRNLRVRFQDWNQHIRYFVIIGETTDRRRLVGKLDSGEPISYPKKSRGWYVYYPSAEFDAHAV
jgi:hypothetical protein